MRNTITITGSEVFGNANADIEVTDNEGNHLERKTFEGNIDDVRKQSMEYAKEMYKKHHPAVIKNLFPKSSSESLLDKLVKLANDLDTKGLHKEVDQIDDLINKLKGITNG